MNTKVQQGEVGGLNLNIYTKFRWWSNVKILDEADV